jgi:hypothetical protein
MLMWLRKGFFVMTNSDLTIVWPQLQELIKLLHVIVMEDSSVNYAIVVWKVM